MAGPDIWGVWRADVARFHANDDRRLRLAGDTNQAHQGRCVQLLLLLHPDPPVGLIRAMAFHDLGESGIGDVAGPAKRDDPDLADAVAYAESRRMARLGVQITINAGADDMWIKMIDGLDACLFAASVDLKIMESDDWMEHVNRVLGFAYSLRVWPEVAKAIRDAGVCYERR